MIGHTTVGKTVLFKRLLDKNVTREELLNEPITPGLNVQELPKHIPYGKFEIHLKIEDIAGSKFTLTFEELRRRWYSRLQTVLLVVLSPTSEKKVRADDNEAGADRHPVDPHFVSVQLGYMQALVQGALGARHTIKPKAIVLYMNKFDLFSDLGPEDSTSRDAESEFKSIFAEHIECAQMSAHNLGVKMYPIVGSALNAWNCEKVIKIVGEILFNAK